MDNGRAARVDGCCSCAQDRLAELICGSAAAKPGAESAKASPRLILDDKVWSNMAAPNDPPPDAFPF